MAEPTFWHKQTAAAPFAPDFAWRLPERPTGTLAIVGGATSGFQAVVRTAEFARQNLPLAQVNLVVPGSLSGPLAGVDGVVFAPAGSSGAFKKSAALENLAADAALLIGDTSKNTETATALAAAAASFTGPLVLARDSVDLLTPHLAELLARGNFTIVASLAQTQKILRALYYPKMLMLSAPLLSVAETLHKFTLSYPATLVTFHDNHILGLQGGEVVATPLAETEFAPLSLWNGALAARIAAYQWFGAGQSLAAVSAAVLAR